MVVYIKKATEEHLDKMVAIIEEGRNTLHQQNIPQWQENEGPTRESIKENIIKEEVYLLQVEQKIVGVATILTQLDAAYERIKRGTWESADSSYASIHRVAIKQDFQGQGLAHIFLTLLISTARLMNFTDIRIDTHPENLAMQKLILKAGFHYRGRIFLPVKSGERKAYQLILN